MEKLLRVWDPDQLAGIEARGFIFGAALADRLSAGFIPVRKKGKLPAATATAAYDLEYGRDELEIHRDAVRPGQKIAIVDDLLATGGTVAAVASLLSGMEAQVVGVAVLLELTSLQGRNRLRGLNVSSLLEDEGG
ncbi:MAG: adenine phosphoribosyltransferase, partial [Acidobacteriota bacterium]